MQTFYKVKYNENLFLFDISKMSELDNFSPIVKLKNDKINQK